MGSILAVRKQSPKPVLICCGPLPRIRDVAVFSQDENIESGCVHMAWVDSTCCPRLVWIHRSPWAPGGNGVMAVAKLMDMSGTFSPQMLLG